MFIKRHEYCSFLKTIRLEKLIFIFMNLSSIFSLSWKQLFKDKKSFGIIFLFQILPTAILLLGAIFLGVCARYVVPFFGIDMNNMTFLARFTTPVWITIISIVALLLLLVWLTFQLICSYLSAQGLVWNFQNKSYTFKSLIKSWRGMWSWAGTGLAVGIQFVVIFVIGFLLALGFAYFKEYLALVPIVLAVGTFLFFAISFSLSLPLYFFEWKKYFQATKASKALIQGRWWKTFWYAILAVVITIGVSILFAAIEMAATWLMQFIPETILSSHTVGLFLGFGLFCFYIVQMFWSTVVQMFIQSMTFSIYQSYSSDPAVKRLSKKTQ